MKSIGTVLVALALALADAAGAAESDRNVALTGWLGGGMPENVVVRDSIAYVAAGGLVATTAAEGENELGAMACPCGTQPVAVPS